MFDHKQVNNIFYFVLCAVVPMIYAWYWYWYLDHWYWYWYWYLLVEYWIQDCGLGLKIGLGLG